MIELKKRVGRLLTVRILSPVTEQEWDRFEAEILEVVRMASSQLIFCTDLRGATVFTDRIAERFIAAMRANSPKIKRSAVIIPSDSAVLALQFERIVREVGYSWRRTFRTERETTAWLGEVLLPAEKESLSAFLAEWAPGSRPSTPGSRPSTPGSRPSAPGNPPAATPSSGLSPARWDKPSSSGKPSGSGKG